MVHAIMVLGSDTGISSFAPPLLGRLTSRGGHMNIGRHDMKPWAKQFYNSKEWQACREAYIASKQGLCERCLGRNTGELLGGRNSSDIWALYLVALLLPRTV